MPLRDFLSFAKLYSSSTRLGYQWQATSPVYLGPRAGFYYVKVTVARSREGQYGADRTPVSNTRTLDIYLRVFPGEGSQQPKIYGIDQP